MMKIAINGFGRIGRLALREIMKNKSMEVVAINDLSAPSMLAYLLKYAKRFPPAKSKNYITFSKNFITLNRQELNIFVISKFIG